MEKIVSPFEFSSIEKTALAQKAEQEKLDYEQQRIDKLKEITSNVVALMEQFTEISNETYDPANRTDYNPNANNGQNAA